MGGRGQGSPPAIRVMMPPCYPGWTPDPVGHPDPTPARMGLPTAIMKGRPAPGIVRLPVPAAIGVNPATPITVRPPGMVHNDNRRLPAPAVIVHFHPGS